MKKEQYMKAALCALLFFVAAGCGDTLDKAHSAVVKPVRVTGVQLPAFSVGVGLTRTVSPVFAPLSPSDAKFTLESSDSSVLQVSENDVTGVKNGIATLTLTSDDGGFTASAQIEVLNIYVAGEVNYSPGYWKNGTWTSLSGDSETSSILVDKTGNLWVGAKNENQGGGYWKNGVRTFFPGDDYNFSMVLDAAEGTDGSIYFAGMKQCAGYSPSGNGYWKNGTWTTVQIESNTYINCIDIDSNGNILCGGTTGSPSVPGYWKNGIWKNLPQLDTTKDSWITDIACDAMGTLYVCGNNSGNTIMGYWKNGIWMNLPVPSPWTGSFVGMLSIDSLNSVYVSGCVRDGQTVGPCYWKDGVIHELDASSRKDCLAKGIVTSANGDIIIVGYYGDNGNTKPMMWFNGEIVDLALPAGEKTAYAKYVAISVY